MADWNRGAQPYCDVHGFEYHADCPKCRREHGTETAAEGQA